ncbi:MAG TPA: ABC transporter ATP-binding protein [Exilispira sp.]|nr:ABC transporter ATP-binding protein [Exilispira sp.]
MENSKCLIEVVNLTKIYGSGDSAVLALDKINLKIFEGDFIAIMGASGSGKSTFMNILGTLDVPTSGQYFFNNINVANMDDDERSQIRSKYIGFVFQSFNLVKTLNAVENVELPLFYLKDFNKKNKKNENYRIKRKYIREKAISLLKEVGLQDRLYHKINQLSGGQQQRIAIARALINDPDLILADEPTGNLDSKTSVEIMQIFTNLHNKGKTIVLVTHEHDIASFAKKVVEFKDGKIIEIREN